MGQEHIPGFHFIIFSLAMSHECTCTIQQKQKLGAGQHPRHKSDETQPNSPPLQRETWESEEQAGSLEQLLLEEEKTSSLGKLFMICFQVQFQIQPL